MTTPRKKKKSPATVVFPIRFTEKMFQEIEETARLYDVSRQDVIRLSVAAGLESMRRMGWDGLVTVLADQLNEAAETRGEDS